MTNVHHLKNLARKELMRLQSRRIDACALKAMIDSRQFYEQEGQEIATAGNGVWKVAGLCPFHDDRSAGSFRVNLQNGAYKCFSCGAKGGDVIAFVMHKHGVSFHEALEWLEPMGGLG